MNNLTQKIAKNIIETLGSHGIPPEYGVHHFSVGLENFRKVLDEEYLSSFIKEGNNAFKLVVGNYGGGKTHFLYSIRDLAWEENYIISYLTLQKDSSPFYKLENIYKELANTLQPHLEEELLSGHNNKGIDAVLQIWYSQKYQQYSDKEFDKTHILQSILEDIRDLSEFESISFKNAIQAALKALAKGEQEDFDNTIQWLKKEGYNARVHRAHGILEKIDKSTAFKMIRSLSQLVKQLGYSGIIIFLDEAEHTSSLSTKDNKQLLSNLREVIDECTHNRFHSTMFFYAVPSTDFLERGMHYEALKQRLSTIFDAINYAGVQIKLDSTIKEPSEFLHLVGNKIADIFKVAHSDFSSNEKDINSLIENIAKWSEQRRFADIGYKREFVIKLIAGLGFIYKKKRLPTSKELGLEE